VVDRTCAKKAVRARDRHFTPPFGWTMSEGKQAVLTAVFATLCMQGEMRLTFVARCQSAHDVEGSGLVARDGREPQDHQRSTLLHGKQTWTTCKQGLVGIQLHPQLTSFLLLKGGQLVVMPREPRWSQSTQALVFDRIPTHPKAKICSAHRHGQLVLSITKYNTRKMCTQLPPRFISTARPSSLTSQGSRYRERANFGQPHCFKDGTREEMSI
jgi:hypothetical protein